MFDLYWDKIENYKIHLFHNVATITEITSIQHLQQFMVRLA